MKIRQHINIGATTTSGDDEEPVAVVPGLNAGHRAEWVEEMMIVSDVYMAQGDRAFNGPRLTDGRDPQLADPAHRTSQEDANAAGVVGGARTAAVEDYDAEAAATLAAWRVIAAHDDEDASNGAHDDDEEDDGAGADAAYAAAGQ